MYPKHSTMEAKYLLAGKRLKDRNTASGAFNLA